jgi:gliding motility-associated-like protein
MAGAWAQPCSGDPGNFISYFGTSGEDRVSTVQRIGDEGYAILWMRFDGSTYYAYVTMIDLCGDLLWQKSMHGQVYGLPTGLVYADEKLYIACYKDYPNVETALVVLDLQGNLLSSKTLATDNTVYPRRMIATADGNFVMTGVSNSAAGAGTNDFFICKITPDGTFLWSKMIGSDANDFGHNIMQDTYGNYLVCGYTRDYVPGVYKGCAMKLNAGGNLIWAKEFHKGNGYTTLGHVAQHGNFYYWSGGSNYGTQGDYDALLIKTDLDGNVIWSKFYGTGGPDRMAAVKSVGAEIYITGTAHSGSQGTEAFVGKIDENGVVLEFGSFGTGTDENCNGYGVNFGVSATDFFGVSYGAAGLGGTDVLFYRFQTIGQICQPTEVNLQVINADIQANNYSFEVNTPAWSFVPVTYILADVPFISGMLCEGVDEPSDTIYPEEPPIDTTGNINNPSADPDYVFLPVNVFSPDGDGINDLFTFSVYAEGIADFHCVIVNRWGLTLAEIDDITAAWDGRDLNGHLCSDGVYFYLYSGTFVTGLPFSGQGTVQIVGSDIGP